MRNRVRLKSSIVLENRQIALTHTHCNAIHLCVCVCLCLSVCLHYISYCLFYLCRCLHLYVYIVAYYIYIYIRLLYFVNRPKRTEKQTFSRYPAFLVLWQSGFSPQKNPIKNHRTSLHFTSTTRSWLQKYFHLLFFSVLIKGLTNLHDNFFAHSGYKCFLSYAIDLLYTLCQLNEVTWPMADPSNGCIYIHTACFLQTQSLGVVLCWKFMTIQVSSSPY